MNNNEADCVYAVYETSNGSNDIVSVVATYDNLEAAKQHAKAFADEFAADAEEPYDLTPFGVYAFSEFSIFVEKLPVKHAFSGLHGGE